MKTQPLLAIALTLLVCGRSAQVVSFLKTLDDARKADQQREAQLKKIQAETKKQQEAAREATRKQKEAIQAIGDLDKVKIEAKKMAETNAVELAQLRDERAALETEKANLEYDKQLLEIQTEKNKLDISKLEIKELILSGSTLGLLVTTVLGVMTTVQRVRTTKIDKLKGQLEILKLERELGISPAAATTARQTDVLPIPATQVSSTSTP